MLARQIRQPVREIVYRTRGHAHGPITRLMSPADLGESPRWRNTEAFAAGLAVTYFRFHAPMLVQHLKRRRT